MLVTTTIITQDNNDKDIEEHVADAFETGVHQDRIKQYLEGTTSLERTLHDMYNII